MYVSFYYESIKVIVNESLVGFKNKYKIFIVFWIFKYYKKLMKKKLNCL